MRVADYDKVLFRPHTTRGRRDWWHDTSSHVGGRPHDTAQHDTAQETRVWTMYVQTLFWLACDNALTDPGCVVQQVKHPQDRPGKRPAKWNDEQLVTCWLNWATCRLHSRPQRCDHSACRLGCTQETHAHGTGAAPGEGGRGDGASWTPLSPKETCQTDLGLAVGCIIDVYASASLRCVRRDSPCQLDGPDWDGTCPLSVRFERPVREAHVGPVRPLATRTATCGGDGDPSRSRTRPRHARRAALHCAAALCLFGRCKTCRCDLFGPCTSILTGCRNTALSINPTPGPETEVEEGVLSSLGIPGFSRQ